MMTFEEIVKHFGSQARVAEILGVRQETISYRARRQTEVDPSDAIKLVGASDGSLSFQKIRPDIAEAMRKEAV